jgi:phosphate transport system protein
VLFNPNTSDPNPQLLVDIVKISQLVDNALQVMLLLLETENPQLAYLLLTEGQECHIELQEGIKHQLSFVVQDARMIGRALDIMQIMKALEGCVEFCHNIAEYMIFKIEGINIRHSDSFATMP